MDKILGGTPATKPTLVIDNNTETVNINDDHETQKVCNNSIVESVAGTDTSTSSEGSSKAAVPKDNKLNKHSREDQLQSIMSGIIT